MRDRLRALTVYPQELPRFDTDALPGDPLQLFREWLDAAIAARVLQPNAMTLATASAEGVPSARTLLLKDLDESSLWFASLSTSPKGVDIAENPHVAIVVHWREQGRQVRVTGDAVAGSREVAAADFLARRPEARARAMAGRQSEPLGDVEAEVAAARARLEAEPGYVPEAWTAYRVIPHTVEFWQAERERDQVRVRYSRAAGEWTHGFIWP